MSRIGNKIINVPAGVEIKISETNFVTVKGPKGTLEAQMPEGMGIVVEDGIATITRPNDLKKNKAFHGLTRSLVANMVTGVTEGFKKTLLLNGVGYRASKQGSKLVMSLGYSHPVEMEDPAGVTSTTPDNTTIVVEGIDKQKVGQYAAEIRSKRAPEPYKGKGVKYSDEVIRRKEGKSGKK